MPKLPERIYYHIEDLAERWSLPVREIEYYIEQSHLTAHIRLYDTELDVGMFEDSKIGKSYFIPHETQTADGLYAL